MSKIEVKDIKRIVLIIILYVITILNQKNNTMHKYLLFNIENVVTVSAKSSNVDVYRKEVKIFFFMTWKTENSEIWSLCIC